MRSPTKPSPRSAGSTVSCVKPAPSGKLGGDQAAAKGDHAGPRPCSD
jgi:hypothetical protein